MNIKDEIAGWDGKSADDMARVYDRHCRATSFVSNLLQLSRQPDLQNGVTWLLKRHLDHEAELQPAEVDSVCRLLAQLQPWQARLHMLQCFARLRIPVAHKSRVEVFIRQCLEEDAKFVRAWAYSAFYELAVQYPEFQPEAEPLLAAALQNEPASVQARIRTVLRRGFS